MGKGKPGDDRVAVKDHWHFTFYVSAELDENPFGTEPFLLTPELLERLSPGDRKGLLEQIGSLMAVLGVAVKEGTDKTIVLYGFESGAELKRMDVAGDDEKT